MAESSFTIPGTKAAIPKKFALLGAGGLVALFLLLKGRGQAPQEEGQFNEEGSLEQAEGVAGAGGLDLGALDDIRAMLQQMQQQSLGQTFIPQPASFQTLGGGGGVTAFQQMWDPSLLQVDEDVAPAHEAALIREEESPALQTSPAELRAAQARIAKAETRSGKQPTATPTTSSQSGRLFAKTVIKPTVQAYQSVGPAVEQGSRILQKTFVKPAVMKLQGGRMPVKVARRVTASRTVSRV